MKILRIILIILVLFLTFRAYFNLPQNIALYKVIDNSDYRALQFLSDKPVGNLIASPGVSVAVYPISRQHPIAAPPFYGERKNIEDFFNGDCKKKLQIIKNFKVSYILSKEPIDCNYTLIYHENNYIYSVNLA